ncbi:MAG: tetratricopeptide repeat protein [Verrucomicrobiae bacterium]|nr:tetratricopeptide repeat protein [Verrucomicrobiae bacterium]
MRPPRNTYLWLAAAWLALACQAGTGAPSSDAVASFESANRLYEQGKFDDAIAAYEKLLNAGVVSPAVYFNLGNAYFKSGRLGRAIAAYRAAHTLAPRDPDIRANLRFARDQVSPPTFSPGRLVELFSTVTLNEWTCAASAAFWTLFLLLAVGEVKPEWKLRMRPAIWLVGGAFVALCVCFGLARHAEQVNSQTVVVVEREAAVRQGPLDAALQAFVVHDGAELKVLDQKDDWLFVAAGQRRLGWIKRTIVQQPVPGAKHQ